MTPLSKDVPAALLSLSPPPSVAPERRPSGLRHRLDESDSEGEALDAKYGQSDDELPSASFSAHRERLDKSLSKSKRAGAGRHSTAAGAGTQMTLREQEQVTTSFISS